MSVDPKTELMTPLTRLWKKLGINEFREYDADGEQNEDYIEPFTGLRGIKHTLSVYLLKLVHAVHAFCR